MIPSWARVGAKVVCVDNKIYRGEKSGPMPNLREPVTVKAFLPDSLGRGPHLIIEEFPNIGKFSRMELGWRLSRFRPLITEADDIALFKSLLNPTLVDKLDLLAERLDHIYNE